MKSGCIEFLKKPYINIKNLDYIISSKSVYANLYKIKLRKDLALYQYPFNIYPPLENGDTETKDLLFKECSKLFERIFGNYFISGEFLYSIIKINETKIFKFSFYKCKSRKEYNIEVDRYESKRTIIQNNGSIDQFGKQIIEIFIRDILCSSPNLDY